MPPHRLMVWWLSAFWWRWVLESLGALLQLFPYQSDHKLGWNTADGCWRLSAFEMSPSTSESAGEQAGLRYMFALLDFPSWREKDISGRDEMGRCWWWANCFIFQLIFHFSSKLSTSQSQEFINLIFHQEKNMKRTFVP